jgi:disulfide bond formation protein DsbB
MNVYLFQRVLATGVLILQIAIVCGVIILVSKKDSKIRHHLETYVMHYGLTVAVASLLGSLALSEIYLLEPCKWCWIQRIFHYPQIIIFSIAILKKDSQAWLYVIWLAGIGLAASLYQILIQFSPTIAKTALCSTNPSVASCSKILSIEYGFITIPVMSATLYLAIILLYFLRKKNKIS